jgi:hypothetical protein
MSSPGKILLYSQTPTSLSALLYNFDVGRTDIKPEHTTWIMTTVVPFAKRQNFKIGTVGMASRTGSEKLNLELSKNRAQAVLKQIWFHNPGKMLGIAEVYAGEKAAEILGYKDNVEDDKFRGVLVNVTEEKAVTYTPPPRKFVERRLFIKYLTKERISSEGWKDGGPGYQAGKAVRDHFAGSFFKVLREEKLEVDETFGILSITVEKTSSSHGIPGASGELEFLDVRFEWGPYERVNGRFPAVKLVFKPVRGSAQIQIDHVTYVSSEDGWRWHNDALRMYESKSWMR